MITKARLVYSKWCEDRTKSSECWEELTGLVYADDTARKYMNAIGVWLENGTESRLGNTKVETKLEKATNDKGETIYTQTSNMLIEIQNLDNKTPAEMMVLHGYDPIKWELLSCSNKVWNGTSKAQGTYTMYSSSIRVSPIQDKLSSDSIIEVYERLKPPKLVKHTYNRSGGKLLEFPIMDIHLGKLAWDKESGEDYDLDIAETLYKKTVSDIISRINASEIELIIFPIGQDFFNVDNDKSETNKGTLQSIDSRWQKMYQKGCELVIWAIEQLRVVAPVKVAYVAGNHCYMLSYFLTINTYSWYRDCEDVSVSISPSVRKYYEFGKCMIGYSHGEEPMKRLDKIMQAEQPEMWGRTKYRELHLGHLHSEHVEESMGLIIRRISSITRPDNWHTSRAYVGTIKKAQAFIWDKENGLELIINSSQTI